MTQTETESKGYHIGNYMIYPETKTISKGQMIGGVDWDGYGYFPDSTINYNTTSLILMKNIIEFRERLEGIDFKTLKSFPGLDWFMDKNAIYKDAYSIKYPVASLKDLRQIGNTLYEREDGKIAYIHSYYGLMQWVSDVVPDKPTLIHLADGFFMDKNGLYNVKQYMNDGVPVYIDKYDGSMPDYKVYESYITVGDKVFARIDNKVFQLDLDVKNVREYIYNRYDIYYTITDGKKTYYYSKRYRESDFQEIKNLRGRDLGLEIKLPFILEINKQRNMLNFKPEPNEGEGLLFFNAKTGIYTRVNMFRVYTYNRMYIYNNKTKKREPFDYKKYKYLGENLYVYDGTLYANGAMPVIESFEVDNLHIIQDDNIVSNFVTDGKRLLCNAVSGSIKSSGETGHIYKDEFITDIVDFETLEIISPNLLIDKNNIYWGQGTLNIIPRKELGIKIEVYR